MNYLLLICSDGTPTPEKAAAMHREVPRWLGEMDGRGVRRFGHALQGPSTAVSVRVRAGETLISDGPFVESKEFVGGFDVIDCADLDEAIEVAAKHPVASFHRIEVRPFAELTMGSSGPADPEQRETAADVVPAAAIGDPPAGRQRYLLLPCVNGIPGTDEEEAAIRRDAEHWVAEARSQGVHVYGHALKDAETATTVRVRDGETVISDGPFVETKEFIGGFDIADCAGPDEAIALAAAHPLARHHVVEVRPFASEK